MLRAVCLELEALKMVRVAGSCWSSAWTLMDVCCLSFVYELLIGANGVYDLLNEKAGTANQHDQTALQ